MPIDFMIAGQRTTAGEDAMLLAEKGWAPRFPQTTDPRPIGELVETFGRLRAQEIC